MTSTSPRPSPQATPSATLNPGAAEKRWIRVKKTESAFVYAIFEAHEGVLGYSTVGHQPGVAFCDLELQIPDSRLEEAEHLLKSLGDLIYELDSDPSLESPR